MSVPPLQTVASAIAEMARRFGPYVLTELLLPGGTLLALFLYLSRLRRARLARVAAGLHQGEATAAAATRKLEISRRARVLFRRARLAWHRRLHARLPARVATNALGWAPRS
jgi:hypothetical protein